MPLAVAQLASQLAATRGNLANQIPMAAADTADAVVAFWTTGLGPQGAAVIALAAKPIITSLAMPAFAPGIVTSLSAQLLATAIDTASKVLILVGGTYGVHITIVSPGPSGLKSGLESAWNARLPSAFAAAKMEADAIMAYTQTLVAFGTGIPLVSPPAVGPII